MSQATTVRPPEPAQKPASSLQKMMRRRSTIAFMMCLPLIVLIVTLVIYPAIYAIYLAMLNKRMTKFVGFDNFLYLLNRETFRMVIMQSVIFAVSAVVLKALIGFILAHHLRHVLAQSRCVGAQHLLLDCKQLRGMHREMPQAHAEQETRHLRIACHLTTQ